MADTTLAASPAKSPLVILADGEAATTSLAVAEFFGKRHEHVMRDIRNLIDQMPPGERSPKFGESVHLVKMGSVANRAQHYFAFNFDAFVLLTMGYDGPKALRIKLAYIGEFNAMRSRLQAAALAPLIAQRDQLQVALADAGGVATAFELDLKDTQAELIKSQAAQIRLLGQVAGLHRRMDATKAKQTMIDMERRGEPRELIALRTGRTAVHIRNVLMHARRSGVLPPLAEGNFAANLVASARTLQAAQRSEERRVGKECA